MAFLMCHVPISRPSLVGLFFMVYMVEYAYDDKVTIEGKEVFFYSRETPERLHYFTCPPKSLYDALTLAWCAMKPGMYSPYQKATPGDISHYLQSMGISKEVALWAGKMAEKYYEKKDFAAFLEQYKEK
jgi:hypothetical protein